MVGLSLSNLHLPGFDCGSNGWPGTASEHVDEAAVLELDPGVATHVPWLASPWYNT